MFKWFDELTRTCVICDGNTRNQSYLCAEHGGEKYENCEKKVSVKGFSFYHHSDLLDLSEYEVFQLTVEGLPNGFSVWRTPEMPWTGLRAYLLYYTTWEVSRLYDINDENAKYQFKGLISDWQKHTSMKTVE